MDWRRLYAAAMLEANPVVLGPLANEFSAAGGHGERDDIREATASLLKLKTAKLGWVDQAFTKIGIVSITQDASIWRRR
jgi:hypothetical protein